MTASIDMSGLRVLGIGVDIVETTRIETSLTRFGERFLARVFTEGESEYCRSMPFPARHYAARFAAKEAVSKAFGTGIGAKAGWRDLEVKRRESGEPYLVLHGAALETAERLGVTQSHLSLSHTEHYAVANAILLVKS